jgi:hypothetical protein
MNLVIPNLFRSLSCQYPYQEIVQLPQYWNVDMILHGGRVFLLIEPQISNNELAMQFILIRISLRA